MNQQRFLILVGLAVVISVAAWFASHREQSRYGLDETAKLAPELAPQLEQITRLKIQRGGGEPAFHLQRQDDSWVVPERGNYPADVDTLRTELRKLARSKTLEAKTSLASNYARLGVQDVDLAEPGTVQLTAWAGESPVIDVIIGQAGKTGSYVRLAGEAQSWVLDERLNPPKTAAGWLDKRLLDIPRQDIATIEAQPAEGDAFALRKPDRDAEDFDLDPPPPDGRKSNFANFNRMGAALARLRLQDVVSDVPEDLRWDEAIYTRQDGLQIQARVAEDGERHLLQLAATVVDAPWPATDDNAEAADATASADKGAANADETAEQARQRIARRVSGQTFEIGSYNADAMRIAYEHMLKKPPDEGSTP